MRSLLRGTRRQRARERSRRAVAERLREATPPEFQYKIYCIGQACRYFPYIDKNYLCLPDAIRDVIKLWNDSQEWYGLKCIKIRNGLGGLVYTYPETDLFKVNWLKEGF